MTSEEAKIEIEPSLIKRFVPLNSLPLKQVKDLSQRSKLIKVKPKTLLFKRGVETQDKYYLVSGRVDLCDKDFKVKQVQADVDNVCLAPLNSMNPTQCAAVATSASTLLLINSDRLDLVLTWSQAGDYVVEEFEGNEDDNQNDDWMSDLLQSNLLQRIPPGNIQQLFTSFKHEDFRKGQDIIRQGDVGEHFYVLKNGTAQVIRSNDTGEDEILANLTSGKFFGEEALISESPRNATVRMLTDGACMKLDKATFNRLLKEPVLSTMSAKQVKAMQMEDPKVRIIDLRLQQEAQSEPLENVLKIPFNELRARLGTLDKNLTYIVHSIAGRRAELGAYLLNDAGFEAHVMK